MILMLTRNGKRTKRKARCERARKTCMGEKRDMRTTIITRRVSCLPPLHLTFTQRLLSCAFLPFRLRFRCSRCAQREKPGNAL